MGGLADALTSVPARCAASCLLRWIGRQMKDRISVTTQVTVKNESVGWRITYPGDLLRCGKAEKEKEQLDETGVTGSAACCFARAPKPAKAAGAAVDFAGAQPLWVAAVPGRINWRRRPSLLLLLLPAEPDRPRQPQRPLSRQSSPLLAPV